MKRVQLVVTGESEALGLHLSLKGLFPEVEFLRPVRTHSFTSTPLVDPLPAGVVDTLDKFAQKLVQKIDEEDDTMVIGVDDLELHGESEVAAATVRAAVTRALHHPAFGSSQSRRERLGEQVSSRCSFHLLVPMLEAYFYGEPAALSRAGVVRQSRFDSTTTDVEAFVVNDPEFGEPDSRHPKRYLSFLSDGAYRETKEGVAALKGLDWPMVLRTAHFTQSARSLVSDISDFLELPPITGAEHVATSRGTQRRVRVLRNL